MIAGTDSPINPYGLSLLLELEHYVRGGLTPAEAISTATAVPAEAMGLGADLGTIEPGKLADSVVVDGNPLANITDIRKTRTRDQGRHRVSGGRAAQGAAVSLRVLGLALRARSAPLTGSRGGVRPQGTRTSTTVDG